jgi:MFS family permease
LCAFLFHLANAAMLPQLGEMLAKGNERAAAPFMSACIIVTQLVIACSAAWVGRTAGRRGRKPLLLVAFAALPVRGALYAVTHVTAALVAIQVLDGVANSIFGVVSILVVADRMRGTGHFNFAQGALATCVGLGAALSTTYGGLLAHHFGFPVSFVGLGAVAGLALVLLWFGVPETLEGGSPEPAPNAEPRC